MNLRLVPPSRLARLSLRMQGDERLAELAGLGSEAAFEAIVHRYRRALLAHCAQVVGESDADEALQEALLKAHRALAGGTPVHSLGPWLHAIAHNSALAVLAAAPRRRRISRGRRDRRRRPEQVHRERLDALVGALLSLPARQRQALVMREFEGRSYDEIATRLGASNGAVRQLLNRARTSIRERLGALIPVDCGAVDTTTTSSGSSRAWTLAGSGALAAKLSGAVLMSAAPVVAVTPVPGVVPRRRASMPGRPWRSSAATPAARSAARHRQERSVVGVSDWQRRSARRRTSPGRSGTPVPRTSQSKKLRWCPGAHDQNAAYASVVHGSRKNPSRGRIQLLNARLRRSPKIHSRNRTSRGEIRASRASRQGTARVCLRLARRASPKPGEDRRIGAWNDRPDPLTDRKEKSVT